MKIVIIAKESLENDFSNGYLIGEILNKHGLQVNDSITGLLLHYISAI